MPEHCCRDLLSFSQKELVRTGTDLSMRPGSQLAFQMIQRRWMGLKSGLCAGQ
uniref:Uncharacterized protein n=1 Tax=Anguilla anguilla TaxID=7936 RepID=A0A0E9TEU7_ANGAN